MFHYFSSTTLGFYCRRNFLCDSRGGVKRLSRPWGKRPHGNGECTYMGCLAPCVLFMVNFLFSVTWRPMISLSPFGIICLLRYLTRAPLGSWYNTPHWGGGLFRPPLLISETTGPIFKFQTAIESLSEFRWGYLQSFFVSGQKWGH